MSVNVLYCDPSRGPYVELVGAERCWGIDRDARLYEGPDPGVFHPPCAGWGRMRSSHFKYNPMAKELTACGPRAVEQVRQFGGVLEHPDGSALWKECALPRPDEGFDAFGGFTVAVRQVDWGHQCPKPTWLYVVPRAVDGATFKRGLQKLIASRHGTGIPTHCMVGKRGRGNNRPELPKRLRHVTPPEFAELLILIAQVCGI